MEQMFHHLQCIDMCCRCCVLCAEVCRSSSRPASPGRLCSQVTYLKYLAVWSQLACGMRKVTCVFGKLGFPTLPYSNKPMYTSSGVWISGVPESTTLTRLPVRHTFTRLVDHFSLGHSVFMMARPSPVPRAQKKSISSQSGNLTGEGLHLNHLKLGPASHGQWRGIHFLATRIEASLQPMLT
jgi:hypothetical protein